MDKENQTEMRRTNPFFPVQEPNVPFSSTHNWVRDNEWETKTSSEYSHREYLQMLLHVDLTDYTSRSFPDNIQNSNHLKEEIIGFKDIFTIINASRSSTAVTMNEKLKLPIALPLLRMSFPSWLIISQSSLDIEEWVLNNIQYILIIKLQ